MRESAPAVTSYLISGVPGRIVDGTLFRLQDCASSTSLLLPAVMSFRERSTNLTPNYASPQPTGDSVSARRQSSMITNQEPFHAFTTQAVETESPVDEISPQEIPPSPPRPATPSQLPPSSNELRRQSTRRNTNETYNSTSEESDPVRPPGSDSHSAPVSSEAAENSSNSPGRN